MFRSLIAFTSLIKAFTQNIIGTETASDFEVSFPEYNCENNLLIVLYNFFSLDQPSDLVCSVPIQEFEMFIQKRISNVFIKMILDKDDKVSKFISEMDAAMQKNSLCDLFSKMPKDQTDVQFVKVAIEYWLSAYESTTEFNNFVNFLKNISKAEMHSLYLNYLTDKIMDLIKGNSEADNFKQYLIKLFSFLNSYRKISIDSYENFSSELTFVNKLFSFYCPEIVFGCAVNPALQPTENEIYVSKLVAELSNVKDQKKKNLIYEEIYKNQFE